MSRRIVISVAGFENTVGIQVRNDNIAENGLFHTRAREVLDTVRLDHVLQTSASLYFENSVRWSDKFRTILGVREDSYRFHVRGDNPANSGNDHESLASPKLSAVLGPWGETEFYVNGGYGFHSNDARGATITEDPKTHEPVERVTPLVRAKGAEVGLRSVLVVLEADLALSRARFTDPDPSGDYIRGRSSRLSRRASRWTTSRASSGASGCATSGRFH